MRTYPRIVSIGLAASITVMIFLFITVDITGPRKTDPWLVRYTKLNCAGSGSKLVTLDSSVSKSESASLKVLFPASTNASLNYKTVWKYPELWADERNIYTERSIVSGQLTAVLRAMGTAEVIHISNIKPGRQNKFMVVLDGGQTAIFKPKRYQSGCIHQYSINTGRGYDRHFAEIVAFHLDKVLKLYRTPLAIGRKLNFTSRKLRSVLDDDIRNDIRYIDDANEWCYYRSCNSASSITPACTEDGVMEGALILSLSHELGELLKYNGFNMQSIFTKMRLLLPLIGHDSSYILDLVDTAIFDFLIGNTDRHHLEMFKKPGSAILLLDNGKGLASTILDDEYLLHIVKYFCVIRVSLWRSMSTVDMVDELRLSLKFDPLHPIMAEEFYTAINRRRQVVVDDVMRCARKKGWSNVLVYGPK